MTLIKLGKITYSDFTEMHNFIPPRAGDTLRISFERKSGKITVRMDPAHDRRLAEQAHQDQMERLLHAAPGSGVSGGTAAAGGGSLADQPRRGGR